MTTNAQAAVAVEDTPTRDVPRLPRVSDQPAAADDPNPMFGLLVENDDDVAGLLAYGLYKQNKRDWLLAHRARAGREPTSAELEAFILGERIPRRVTTYRRLALDMLAGERPGAAARPGLLDGLMAPPANDVRPGVALAAAAKKP
ncbi:MAG: hypothetical protein ACRCTI_18820, partial [Beijerinckiaceae bacterium]